jgi:hypothetical protein
MCLSRGANLTPAEGSKSRLWPKKSHKFIDHRGACRTILGLALDAPISRLDAYLKFQLTQWLATWKISGGNWSIAKIGGFWIATCLLYENNFGSIAPS